MEKVYDYIIVGAGPAGMMLAWGLARHTKSRILLVDREDSIGGCHRVRRVDKGNVGLGLFSEHGPRIYIKNYFVLQQMMSEMELSWSDYFTGYTEMSRVFGDMNQHLSFSDYLKFVPEFLWMMVDESRARRISVEMWAESVGMSRDTIDFLDRVCRLTDGAGADRYTLFEFLQLVNQNGLYQIQQPRRPLDVGLWNDVETNLRAAGVDLMLGTEAVSLIDGGVNVGGHPVGVWVNRNGMKSEILGRKIILATPPQPTVRLLGQSGPQLKQAFGNFDDLDFWEKMVRYITYVPITFHWKSQLKLPPSWGYPKSSWGLAFIPLTDYMDQASVDDLGGMKTVISVCLTKVDTPSPVTGKTVNETYDVNELMSEAFRQLRESYPDLPLPDHQILSPEVSRSADGTSWETRDTAFMLTSTGYLKDGSPKDSWPGGGEKIQNGFQSLRYLNLYWCGVQNGLAKYHFTSMESAMSNAVKLLHMLVPSTQNVYHVHQPWSLTHLIYLLIMILLIVGWYYWKY